MSKKQLIKLHRVLAKVAMSKTLVYKKIREGEFPAPLKLTERSVAWLESEIDEWIESREKVR